jgi:hypothetical protein
MNDEEWQHRLSFIVAFRSREGSSHEAGRTPPYEARETLTTEQGRPSLRGKGDVPSEAIKEAVLKEVF